MLEKATSCCRLPLTIHQPDGNFRGFHFQNTQADYLIFIVELASAINFCSGADRRPRPGITHTPTVWSGPAY